MHFWRCLSRAGSRSLIVVGGSTPWRISARRNGNGGSRPLSAGSSLNSLPSPLCSYKHPSYSSVLASLFFSFLSIWFLLLLSHLRRWLASASTYSPHTCPPLT